MNRLTAAAVSALLVASGASAGSLDVPADPPAIAPPAPAPATPDLIFTLRGGITGTPTYFGSDSYEAGPDFGFSFGYLALPGGRSLGSTDPDFERYGIVPRGSLRVVKERTAGDNPELAGLNDIDLAVELGLGIGISQPNFEAFADARYGVVGHEAWVGELGANLIARPNDRLTLRAGPRLFLGSNDYAQTYFGVTPAESAASAFPAFAASGGALSAGIEVIATYELNDTWGIEGGLRYDRLMNDAEASPITAQGSADQLSVRLGLTRRFTLDF